MNRNKKALGGKVLPRIKSKTKGGKHQKAVSGCTELLSSYMKRHRVTTPDELPTVYARLFYFFEENAAAFSG